MNWEELRKLRSDLKRPLIMAHRGASTVLPENTLRAFEQALIDGAEILETDLHFSKDDEIVLIHDDTLDRTFEATGQVRDYTLSELKGFSARQTTARPSEHDRMPTLKELIQLTEARVPLALELKDPLFDQPEYGQKLITILHETGLLGRCAVISFNKERVNLVEGLAPELAGGWITMSNMWPNHSVELLGPYWPLILVNPLYVAWAHRLGKFVAPLDPEPQARIGLYLRLGIDIILSDNPGLTLQTITRKMA